MGKSYEIKQYIKEKSLQQKRQGIILPKVNQQNKQALNQRRT